MSVPRVSPLANHDPSALMVARKGLTGPDLRNPGRRRATPCHSSTVHRYNSRAKQFFQWPGLRRTIARGVCERSS